MCEHHSSTSPEDSSSDHETSSDLTLLQAEEGSEYYPDAPSHWVTVHPQPHAPDISASAFFSFHLISGCSTAGREMCQYSRSMTSQEVKKVLGLRGRWSAGSLGLHWWRGPSPAPAWRTLELPSSLPTPIWCSSHGATRDMQEQHQRRVLKPG